MNAAQILSYAHQKGIILTADGGRLNYRAPTGVMTPDMAEMIRAHKQTILSILNQDGIAFVKQRDLCVSDKVNPGDCGRCPAAGYWDLMGTGMWCFHRAYFLGKAGHPLSCETAKHNCPLNI